jgi:hypothetical protein
MQEKSLSMIVKRSKYQQSKDAGGGGAGGGVPADDETQLATLREQEKKSGRKGGSGKFGAEFFATGGDEAAAMSADGDSGDEGGRGGRGRKGKRSHGSMSVFDDGATQVGKNRSRNDMVGDLAPDGAAGGWGGSVYVEGIQGGQSKEGGAFGDVGGKGMYDDMEADGDRDVDYDTANRSDDEGEGVVFDENVGEVDVGSSEEDGREVSDSEIDDSEEDEDGEGHDFDEEDEEEAKKAKEKAKAKMAASNKGKGGGGYSLFPAQRA